MPGKRSPIGIACAAAALVFALAPVSAQAPELAMLDTLTEGAWSLRLRSEGTTQRICLRTGREFIQLRHRQPNCEQYVVQDEANEVTVQYTCRGNGYGRTTIRREGSDIIQVRSQGIYGGAPFSLEGEARHVGPC